MPGVTTPRQWPAPVPLTTARLRLEPLRVDHAEEMAAALDDVALHTYIGGSPATPEELRARYVRQVAGWSADGSQRWFNWVLREQRTQEAVGFVQATVTSEGEVSSADVAWVVASGYQRRGLAREAAAAMVGWLREIGVDVIVAHVHPEHGASAAVAAGLGLHATDVLVDGEVRWEG